jgi:hypothetical protein
VKSRSRNNRGFFACGALFAALGLLLPGFATTGNGQRRVRFDPDGSFWIKGIPPKYFENFSGINLNSKHSRRLQASGVDLTDGTRLSFKNLNVTRDKLVFSTVVVRGYSYSFSGRFLKGGVFAATVLDQEIPVLEGTLTKWRQGQRVANAKLSFTYFGGT